MARFLYLLSGFCFAVFACSLLVIAILSQTLPDPWDGTHSEAEIAELTRGCYWRNDLISFVKCSDETMDLVVKIPFFFMYVAIFLAEAVNEGMLFSGAAGTGIVIARGVGALLALCAIAGAIAFLPWTIIRVVRGRT